MEITTHWFGEALVLRPRGSLDHDGSPMLNDHILVAFQRLDAGALVVDLSEIDYVSSSGLKILIGASRASKEMAVRLFVAAPRPMVVELFEMSHANLLLHIFPTLRDALAAVSTQAARAYESQTKPD